MSSYCLPFYFTRSLTQCVGFSLSFACHQSSIYELLSKYLRIKSSNEIVKCCARRRVIIRKCFCASTSEANRLTKRTSVAKPTKRNGTKYSTCWRYCCTPLCSAQQNVHFRLQIVERSITPHTRWWHNFIYGGWGDSLNICFIPCTNVLAVHNYAHACLDRHTKYKIQPHIIH